MKTILIFLTLFTTSALANPDVKPFDLEANMKNMGLAFKQALKSKDPDTLTTQLKKLKQLVELSKTAKFPDGKTSISIEGLNKVIKQIELAQQLNLDGKFKQAKEVMMQVDNLRKEYHEYHKPPSIWDMIFG